MPTRRPLAVTAATVSSLLVLAALGGCSGKTVVSREGQPDSFVKCEGVDTDQVAVGAPTVTIHDSVMKIAGEVRRKPGATGTLDGMVAIDLLGPDGLTLDKPLHAPLTPAAIPDDPNTPARYAPTDFGYVPPAGSIVRARYISRQEAIKDRMTAGALDYTANGGHTGDNVPRHQENGAMPTSPAGGGGAGNTSR